MDALRPEEIQRQRDRRKRVKRMKSFIVGFLVTWIVISIASILLLGIKVVSLQHQVNALEQRLTEADTSQTAGDLFSDNEGVESEALINYNATAEENLAEAGDTLKVYLTFDDGPSDNSNAILDILDDYNIKATFFVVGKEDDASKEVYRRIVEDGHTIGMHSYSHNYSAIYASLDAFQSDLERIKGLIYDTTGVECSLYRFPGGSSNKVSNGDMTSFIEYLDDEGIRYLDWNVASGDATSIAYTSDDLVENVMRDVVKYKTSVVLLHDADNKDSTVEALPALIERLQGVGALILPVSSDTDMIQHIALAR